jgi:hypothetical protein
MERFAGVGELKEGYVARSCDSFKSLIGHMLTLVTFRPALETTKYLFDYSSMSTVYQLDDRGEIKGKYVRKLTWCLT